MYKAAPQRKARPSAGADFALKGENKMLGIIAAVLIVLWLLGFFAFHVSSGLIHIVLVVGLIMLAVHFLRGRTAAA